MFITTKKFIQYLENLCKEFDLTVNMHFNDSLLLTKHYKCKLIRNWDKKVLYFDFTPLLIDELNYLDNPLKILFQWEIKGNYILTLKGFDKYIKEFIKPKKEEIIYISKDKPTAIY